MSACGITHYPEKRNDHFSGSRVAVAFAVWVGVGVVVAVAVVVGVGVVVAVAVVVGVAVVVVVVVAVVVVVVVVVAVEVAGRSKMTFEEKARLVIKAKKDLNVYRQQVAEKLKRILEARK